MSRFRLLENVVAVGSAVLVSLTAVGAASAQAAPAAPSVPAAPASGPLVVQESE